MVLRENLTDLLLPVMEKPMLLQVIPPLLNRNNQLLTCQ